MTAFQAGREAAMKTIALALVCALGLTGCISQPEEPAKQNKRIEEQAEQIAKADDVRCKGYGLKLGTAAYADCRLKLKKRLSLTRISYLFEQPLLSLIALRRQW